MKSIELLEGHLIALELAFERVNDTMWLVHNPDGVHGDVVVYLTDQLANFRLRVFDLPPNPTMALLRRLLELNASDMVHGAYGIEGNDVVIEGSLEVENLDRNEVQAMLDSFALAIGTHHAELSGLLAACH
jgi:hypothetical protein